ncbi:protein FAR1-RELATED SEQUENCE 5-like, partial [Hevea brasiliensis]|uniref:protein FAR1-RELATED SEQUENCE 5-like n=1 Tax=Hevea brasiliensis TaxID=3981 RepID=UPI0025CE2C80
MEVENERRRRELYDTLGIRDDDSLFDENSLSDEPSNGAPSHGYDEGPVKESQSGSDGQCSNVHEDEIPYNVEEGPKTGMHFLTMDDLVNFYKHHARLKGFSIVIRSSPKGNSSVPKYVLITCDKESKPYSGKSTKRVNCSARINASLKENGLWVVGRVVTDHIHQLDPSMSRFMTHHRGLSNVVKRSLEANDIAGIRPSKSIRLLEVQFWWSKKDGMFRNMLWIHPQGRAAYEKFHDIICFNTTYLVNRYRMPFCNISMVDIHPHAILTDQCESIRAAIREVMPETRHRFCLWHILSKVSEKFKGVEDFTKATNEFKALIFDSLMIEMFETNWNNFLTNTLKQFVEQYEMAIRGKNEKELLSEFISKNRVVNYISPFGWERKFQHAFTHAMFKLIQEQVKRLWYCDVNPPNEDEESNEHGTERYNILEGCIINDWYHKEFVYRVEHRENEQYFNCNCKSFDSSGILCCHILKVIVTKGIEKMEYVKRQLRA